MFSNSWFKDTVILYLTSRAKSEQSHTRQEGAHGSSRPPCNTACRRGHANLPNHRGIATPSFPPRKESFCHILQEHNLTKNFLSTDEPFQNLAMRSKGSIKTCPHFISCTTFLKKIKYWIFSFLLRLGRKILLSRKLPSISSMFKTKPLSST